MLNSTTRTPSWVQELLAKPAKSVVRDQITIISKGAMPKMPESMMKSVLSPLSKGENVIAGNSMDENSRNTGVGPDGILQPLKRAGDVHEGERVLSANASQAIDDQTFGELSRQAEDGILNLNALRMALQKPLNPEYCSGSGGSRVKPMPQYAEGTGDQPAPAASYFPWMPKNLIEKLKQKGVSVTPPLPNLPNINYTGTPIKKPEVITNDITATTPITGTTTQPILTTPTPVRKTTPTPVSITPIPITTTPIPITTTPTPVQTTTAPGPNQYDTLIGQYLQNLKDISEGKSPIVQNIAEQGIRQYDTRAANQLDAEAMALANQRNISESAKRSMTAQEASGVRSGRSELLGTMAAANQQQAMAAGQAAAQLAGSERANQRATTLENINTLMSLGIRDNLGQIVSDFRNIGINIDPNTLTTVDNQQKFSKAMELISSSVASGLDQNQINAILKQNGLYDTLNQSLGSIPATPWTGDPNQNPVTLAKAGGTLTPDQTKWLIDNNYTLHGDPAPSNGLNSIISTLKSRTNTLDQAWNSVSESNWYKTLTPENQQRMKALFDYQTMGADLPFNITQDPQTGRWVVTAKTEDEINAGETGAYTGDPFSAEAMNILKANPNSQQSKSIAKSIVNDLLTRHDIKKIQAIPAGPERNAIANEIAAQSVTWSGSTTESKTDKWRGKGGFADPPTKNTLFSYGGKTYICVSDVQNYTEAKGRWQQQRFSAIDLSTGRTVELNSSGHRVNIIPQ